MRTRCGDKTFLAGVVLLFGTPASARATVRVLGQALRPSELRVERACWMPNPPLPSVQSTGRLSDEHDTTHGGKEAGTGQQNGGEAANRGEFGFDLLGVPPNTQKVNEDALRLRRTMLTVHQGVGLGMFALQLSTTIVGQLNYNDKFGGDNTSKYVQAHDILAYSTLASFAAAATLAWFAPKPIKRGEGFDRVSLHKASMLAATLGMLAEGTLGIWTQSREGYLNQKSIGTAHLAIGYVTLAAVTVGISALVF